MNWPWSNSIARRIKWGYYVPVILVVIGFVLSAIFLIQLDTFVRSLEKDSKLLDTVLEVRRYEKNWILYKKRADFETANQQMKAAHDLLESLDPNLGGPNNRKNLAIRPEKIQDVLTEYQNLMNAELEYFENEHQHKMLDEIRQKGKRLLAMVEERNTLVRRSINETIRKIKISIPLFLGCALFIALVFGKQLSSSVLIPLQQIVACTKRIAVGEKDLTEIADKNLNLEEVQAVMAAFSSMLNQLKNREKLIIKSEKLAAVGTLVAGVAHELNNPISNAGTSAQILLEEMNDTSELPQAFLKEMLEEIVEQTDRARSIVRLLLEFSREKSVHPEMTMVSNILHQTLDLVRGEVPTNVKIMVQVDSDGSFLVDKQRLQQALVNLLLNAFQAVNAEKEAYIILRGNVDKDRGKVMIEVEDNGPGIPPEIKKKIFDPFFTTKDVGDGSGLGLAITREIIDMHGGDITVESTETSGARFIITLPLKGHIPLEPKI